jgi:hypothetical protein
MAAVKRTAVFSVTTNPEDGTKQVIVEAREDTRHTLLALKRTMHYLGDLAKQQSSGPRSNSRDAAIDRHLAALDQVFTELIEPLLD